MQKRTFLRTMLDLFFNNAIIKTIAAFFYWKKHYIQKYDFINFCNNNVFLADKELKFFDNVPLYKEESTNIDSRFIFNKGQK